MILNHRNTFLPGLLVLLLASCQTQLTPSLPAAPASSPPAGEQSPAAAWKLPPAVATGLPEAGERPGALSSAQPGQLPRETSSGVMPVLAEDCPVSQPNLQISPDNHYIALRDGYGNGKGPTPGTIFTNLWPDNTVLFTPHGPGEVRPDGLLVIKWPWYRTMPGEVHITGQRLDGSAPPIPEVVLRGEADGYSATGFHPSQMGFPTQGCWEVTARVGTAYLRMVVRVVQLPFEPAEAHWLPGGWYATGVQLSQDPLRVRSIYRPGDGSPGTLSLETLQTDEEVYTELSWEKVQVGQLWGRCVQSQGSKSGYAVELVWTQERLTYRLQQSGLDLTCRDLVHIANGSS